MGMAKYIEREAAIAEMDVAFPAAPSSEFSNGVAVGVAMAKLAVCHLPAADVRPVVRGKWTMNSDFPDRLICSECGAQFDVWHWEAKQMHFCPNCGADMREKQT